MPDPFVDQFEEEEEEVPAGNRFLELVVTTFLAGVFLYLIVKFLFF